MNVSMENYQTLISHDVTYERTNKKGTPDDFGTSKLLRGPDSVRTNHILYTNSLICFEIISFMAIQPIPPNGNKGLRA